MNQPELVLQYLKTDAGFFVEVGANDPKSGSQTWPLEERGWRGILVEPQSKHYEALVQQRPGAKVFKVACGGPDQRGVAALNIPKDDLNGFATLKPNAVDYDVEYDRTEAVDVRTLDELLDECGVKAVDFVSIDVEGAELDVLRGFSLRRFQPRLLLIEDKGQSLDVHRYMRAGGYKLVKRTEINNWYVPEDVDFQLSTAFERFKLFRKVFLGLPFRKFRQWRHERRSGAK